VGGEAAAAAGWEGARIHSRSRWRQSARDIPRSGVYALDAFKCSKPNEIIDVK